MLWVDGKRLKEGQCIRPYHDTRNYPLKDPNSKDLRCRTPDMSGKGVELCEVKAGSTISVEWHESDPNDRAISESHKGPCLVYLAPLESNGELDVWIKIFEDGYDPTTKKWCVDKVITSKGKLDVQIPSDIASGKYLMRTEIIALHEADRPYGKDSKSGAEYFSNCAHINIVGGQEGATAPKKYSIPGIYDKNDKGIYFNLYDKYSSYPIPGPPLYNDKSQVGSPGGGSNSTNPKPPSPPPKPPAPKPPSSPQPKRKPCVKKRQMKHRV
ncbi:hypothetical protein FBU31_000577 [Coemansia sp. 'formosensis']|nr:hypothetical protein FBU31_000577 [Coemansia sp. 'formosensis']